MKIEFVKK